MHSDRREKKQVFCQNSPRGNIPYMHAEISFATACRMAAGGRAGRECYHAMMMMMRMMMMVIFSHYLYVAHFPESYLWSQNRAHIPNIPNKSQQPTVLIQSATRDRSGRKFKAVGIAP